MAAGGVAGVGILLVTLGVPALACARRLGSGLRTDERVLVGMALGPPLLGLVALPFFGLLHMPAAMALELAMLLAVVGAAWPAARRDRAREARVARQDAFPARGVFALAVLLALLVAIPGMAKPYVRMWSDAWFHTGAAIEIAHHGLPPQDPNFAGIAFHYPWLFHVLLALLLSVTGLSAFALQAALNVWYAPVLALAAAQLAWRLAGRGAAALAMVIVLLGLNPFGAWLWLVRALLGHHGGLGAAWAMLAGTNGAMQMLAFGFAPVQASLLDRFWTGTALTPAIAIGLTLAWSLVALLGGTRMGAWRAFLLALAMVAWHPAYTVLVAVALAAGLVASVPGGSRPRATLAGLLALVAALALAVPYVRYCSLPGVTTPATPGIYGPNVLALVVATGAWWVLAAPALVAAARGGAPARMLLVALGVATLVAVFVVLPERNSEKCFYAAWVLLAPFAAAGVTHWPQRLRLPGVLVWRVTLLLALPTTLLYFTGVMRESRSPGVLVRGYDAATASLPLATAGETEAYARLRDTSPTDAVVIESPRPSVNEPVPVLAERRVFCGSLDVYLSNHFGAAAWEHAAGTSAAPGGLAAVRAEFEVRRGIQQALFATGTLDDAQRRYLDAFGAPLVLMVRRREVSDAVWTRFDTRREWERAFHNDEIKLYLWKGRGRGA